MSRPDRHKLAYRGAPEQRVPAILTAVDILVLWLPAALMAAGLLYLIFRNNNG